MAAEKHVRDNEVSSQETTDFVTSPPLVSLNDGHGAAF